jgi:hypothetical protein
MTGVGQPAMNKHRMDSSKTNPPLIGHISTLRGTNGPLTAVWSPGTKRLGTRGSAVQPV